ncbi:TadE family protein [Sphingomonas sp. F9_3S_D5_B_2]
MISPIRRLAANESGATAIEFSILATAFFALLFGGISASFVGYTSSSLHGAVESAARCRALAVTCTDATTTQTYAARKFRGITRTAATFTSTTQACGNNVTGSLNYRVDWIVASRTFRLRARSCFPTQAASAP